MNPEIKARWVAALRSGEYKQTVGALRDKGGFCCLGVLCDLHSKERGERWDDFSYGGEKMLVPESVQEWSGASRSPEIARSPEHEEDELSMLNDDGLTFHEIADLIEKQL